MYYQYLRHFHLTLLINFTLQSFINNTVFNIQFFQTWRKNQLK